MKKSRKLAWAVLGFVGLGISIAILSLSSIMDHVFYEWTPVVENPLSETSWTSFTFRQAGKRATHDIRPNTRWVKIGNRRWDWLPIESVIRVEITKDEWDDIVRRLPDVELRE